MSKVSKWIPSNSSFDDAANAAVRAAAKKRAEAALANMTDAEDAAIMEAARADPDAQPLGDLFRRKRGRPLAKPGEKKEQVSIKLDADVVARLRGSGPRWQTRVNDALREFAFSGALRDAKAGWAAREAATGKFVETRAAAARPSAKAAKKKKGDNK